ncbi:MAG: hypothetical protein ABI401_12615 [Candidatus Dormibacter sp.]
MTDSANRKVWDRFDADVKSLGDELRRHYKGAGNAGKSAELNRSLDQLKQAADAVFASFETATRDPEVRSRTKQAARSFGSALAETFRDLGDELDKALRKSAPK